MEHPKARGSEKRGIIMSENVGAEDPAITSGVAWLKSRTAIDGSMGKAADVPASAMAILGLSAIGEDISQVKGALSTLKPGDAQDATFRGLLTRSYSRMRH